MNGSRPVYILGSGFSRAINDDMPTLGELGKDIAQEGTVAYTGQPGLEQWLSLHTQDLPFFKDYENMERQAQAQRAIEFIAQSLDEKVNQIAKDLCPEWLTQLVSLWAAEQAVIITFNYDTLLEIAVNSIRPFVSVNPSTRIIKRACADELVYPRPIIRTNGNVKYGDTQTNTPCLNSLQILKPHGSLNWYSYGSGSNSSIIRTRELRSFHEEDLVSTSGEMEAESSEVLGMNRYLIPPSSNKSSFYSVGLDKSIWNQCLDALSASHEVTIMGYSVPETDYVVHELLGVTCRRDDCTLHIVDHNAGTVRESIVKNAFSGQEIEINTTNDISSYAQVRIQDCAEQFARGLGRKILEFGDATIYAAFDFPHSDHRDVRDTIVYYVDVEDNGQLVMGQSISHPGKSNDPHGSNKRLKATMSDLEKVLKSQAPLTIVNSRNEPAIAISAYCIENEILVLRCIQSGPIDAWAD